LKAVCNASAWAKADSWATVGGRLFRHGQRGTSGFNPTSQNGKSSCKADHHSQYNQIHQEKFAGKHFFGKGHIYDSLKTKNQAAVRNRSDAAYA
jgi:hypothetical protein